MVPGMNPTTFDYLRHHFAELVKFNSVAKYFNSNR